MRQFKIQLPDWLHSPLSNEARSNDRTLNGEIINRIKHTVRLDFTDVAARIFMRRARKIRAKNPASNSPEMRDAERYEHYANLIQVGMNQIEDETSLEQS